ncbi:MAG: response regulator [Nitrospirota bacterium]
MSNQAEERRKSLRLPFLEGVSINNSKRGNSCDVSEGGMFICTEDPYETNSVVSVTIPVRLTVKAVVKHHQQGIGVGVQFIDLDDNQKFMINHLIESVRFESQMVESQKKQILIIEDNDLTRKLYKTRLVADGFSVLEARDGVEGISLLAENAPDMIVLDLYMKRMDGFKVLSVIKSSKWANIPVLIFSSLITQDVINRLIEGGADDFLVKQVTSPDELAKAIEAFLERSKK